MSLSLFLSTFPPPSLPSQRHFFFSVSLDLYSCHFALLMLMMNLFLYEVTLYENVIVIYELLCAFIVFVIFMNFFVHLLFLLFFILVFSDRHSLLVCRVHIYLFLFILFAMFIFIFFGLCYLIAW